ncbi:MAG: cobalamin-binding protein [Sedimentisphaerales bacterium]|nr:cobalamin-binding protein [Sedimentisphaerales bacterium]
MAVKKQDNLKYYMIATVLVAVSIVMIFSGTNQTPPVDDGVNNSNLRIVSLAPNITEMLFVLGVQDRLVGRTDCCDYPPAAKNIESVGGLGIANIEKLLSLKPDLLITPNEPEKEVYKLISQAGIKLLVVQAPNVQGMLDELFEIGQAVGRPELAKRVIAEMQAELDVVARLYKGADHDELPRVFIEISNDPLVTIGGRSFINDVVTRAGGVNVAAGISESYPCINPEKVIEWDPDVIIPCYMGNKENIAEQISGRIGWDGISAIRSGQIYSDFPGDLIMRGGPRLIEGIKILAQHLHGKSNKEYVVR